MASAMSLRIGYMSANSSSSLWLSGCGRLRGRKRCSAANPTAEQIVIASAVSPGIEVLAAPTGGGQPLCWRGTAVMIEGR
jgi:hypothetical protein